jgi:predicted MFS family arabinose efflux permease
MTNSITPRFSFWLVLAAAAGAFALTMGVRQSMGLFLSPINTATGLGIGSISLAFACGQLCWGLTQPFAGAIADKVGAGRVLIVGILLVTIGTVITPLMTSTLGLILAIGVLSAGGAGMAGPAVLMAATSRLIAPERRGMATGIVNAGGSFGQFVMAPIAGALSAGIGWAGAVQILGLIVLIALPAAFILRSPKQISDASGGSSISSVDAVRAALSHSGFRLLSIGFLVCGFHVALLATHLPSVIAACGLPSVYGGWALAMLGLFNIIGSILMGWAVGQWRMKSLLSLVYAARAIAILLFLLAPKTGTTALIFAAVMGITFLSTVPPTAGLVAKFFGVSNMATLFGVVMLSHQIGGFMGAWMGGKVFELTGSYDWIWYVDILLAVGAALIHLPIKEVHLNKNTSVA